MRQVPSGVGFAQRCATKVRLGLLVVACSATPAVVADSLHVVQAARGTSTHVLELRLDPPSPGAPDAAYAAIGPERGLADETAVGVAVSLDLGRLGVVARDGRPSVLEFLRLAQHDGPDGTRLVLFLSSGPQGAWWIGAWNWDDTRGGYVLAGHAPLAAGTTSDENAPRRVALEWTAAATEHERGSLRLWRTEGPGKALLFERSDLDNARQTLNHLLLGLRSGDGALGVVGVLGIDDLALHRLASTPQSPQDMR